MSDAIISVENLGKKYAIRHQAQRGGYKTLRETLVRKTASLFSRQDRQAAQARTREDFWALKDVSFDLERGKVLGIIGRNGAGKSTLLKILSRITEPSEGRVTLRGRVASLLEVGTGFHQELTGRENILLNGSILGMSRLEIRRKFDEIIAFAGVEKFLDTPVKRYSSGMYVRLAFAVAAHLEPEILIVDEVLAVGDAEFQKRCLGKMQEVTRGGRTVIFVSHNMNAVESLCQQLIHLEQGRIAAQTNDVRAGIARYLSVSTESGIAEWRNPGNAFDNQWFQPVRFSIEDENGNVLRAPTRRDTPLYVVIEGKIEQLDTALQVGYALHDETGSLLYWSTNADTEHHEWPRLQVGQVRLRSRLPMEIFNEGSYTLDLFLGLYCIQWISQPGYTSATIPLTIEGGITSSPYWTSKRPTMLAPVCRWSAEAMELTAHNSRESMYQSSN
jgi:lipopolysaccharide transport system ATP-binding protein